MIGALNPAVRRLAWRQLRQHRGRTIALFTLTFVPLTVSMMLGIFLASSEPGFSGSTADLQGEVDQLGFQVDRDGRIVSSLPLDEAVESWREALPGATIETWPITRTRIGWDSIVVWSVPQQQWSDGEESQRAGPLKLLDGRAPEVGEVAMSSSAMAAYDIELGDSFPWADGERTVVAKFVGQNWQHWIGLPEEDFAADTDAPPSLWFAIDLGPHTSEDGVEIVTNNSHLIVEEPLEQSFAATSSSLTSLGFMVVVSLVAGAAWAAGVRRRLRDAGLVVLNGAERGHVASIILFQALVISLAGGLLAVNASVVLSSFLDSVFPSLYVSDGVIVSPFVVVVPLIIGVGASLLAAWWPARRASRMPVGATLAGRLPAASFRNSVVLPIPGLVAGIVGLSGMSWLAAEPSSLSTSTIGILGGVFLLLIMVSLGSCIPLILTVVSRVAGKTNSLLRLVARDNSRHPLRTAMATAALIAVFAGPVLILLDQADSSAEFGTASSSGLASSSLYQPPSAVISHPNADVRQELAAELIDRGLVVASAEAVYSSRVGDLGSLLISESELSDVADALYQTNSSLGNLGLRTVDDDRYAEEVKNQYQRATLLVVNPANDGDDLRFLAEQDFVRYDTIAESPGLFTPDRVIVGLVLIAALVISGAMTIITAAEVEPDLQTIIAIGAPASVRRTYLAAQALFQSGLAMILGVLGAVALHLVTVNSTSALEIPFTVESAVLLSIPFLLAGSVWLLTRPMPTGMVSHG